MDDVTATARAALRATARTAIDGRLVRLGERAFAGHAFDPRDPSRRLAVELLVDSIAVAITRADLYDPALLDCGDPCHAFRFVVDDYALEPGSVVSARLANLDLPVGTPIVCATAPVQPLALPGLVRVAGGLRFTGWVAPRDGEAWVTAMIDGEAIAEIRADAWTRPAPPADPATAVPAFDFQAPERFADGRLHRLTVRNAAGEALAGSPLAFVADRARHTLPLAEYESWRERHPSPPVAAPDGDMAVVLAGPDDAAATLASLAEDPDQDWLAVALPDGAGPAFDREAALAFLDGEARDARLALFALAGSRLRPGAIARLADALALHPDAPLAYADLERAGEDGSLWPILFPAFDRDRQLEQGYAAYFFALPAARARAAIAAGAGDLYALFHTALAACPSGMPVAVPGPLATLPRLDAGPVTALLAATAREACRRSGIDATMTPTGTSPFPAIRVLRRNREPIRLAVIAPQPSERTEACLASLGPARDRSAAPPLVVTGGDPAGIAGDAVHVSGDATRARLVGYALEAAGADLVCVIDDATLAPDGNWLDELLGRMAEPDVAAVAPMVVGGEGLVRHAGAVLGTGFALAPAFVDATVGDPGHGGCLAVAHEVSALEPGCILYRRDACLAAGGMDEVRFPRFFADADLCLRLRATGRRILVTPHARFLDTRATAPDRGAPAAARELRAFRAIWGEALLGDPFYSPLLSLDADPWSALAAPPRDMAPRRAEAPVMVDVPPGF